jgi:ABC-type uncharacterized transport system substrate-binding protein
LGIFKKQTDLKTGEVVPMRKGKLVLFKTLICIVILGLCCSGCSLTGTGTNGSTQNTIVDVSGGAQQDKFPSSPQEKPGGGKYRIAYVDIDPYDVTGSMLYYVIESLKEKGWIRYDSLPMSADNVDAGQLIKWLSEQNLGPYMEFDNTANYYLSYQGKQAVAQSLLDHVNNKKDIDMIFAMGTTPGLFVKSLNLNVPTIVYGSVNPIASGIIKSSADSGYKNLWAQVDTTAFTRQIEFYYNTVHFKNIGMVYNNPVVGAIPDYEAAAKADNFNITKVQINELTSNKQSDKDAYYAELKQIYQTLVTKDKIDAYLINTDVITDDSQAKDLFKIFTAAKIPVFVQVGDNYVKDGAFMMVSPADYKGLGSFVAYTIGAILNGASPEKLPQNYVSSPYLSINLDTSKSISYTPTFEMLMSCETIYSSKSTGK